MYRVYIGLGTNLGDRMDNLSKAVAGLREIATLVSVSSVYETEAVGMPDGARFLNMVAAIDTTDDPPLLLVKLKKIERGLGRKSRSHNLPRVIDLDILLYRGMAYEDNIVTVPHPELHRRKFALEPLHEIAPTAVHTTMEKTAGWLLRHCQDSHSVVRTGELSGIESSGIEPSDTAALPHGNGEADRAIQDQHPAGQ